MTMEVNFMNCSKTKKVNYVILRASIGSDDVEFLTRLVNAMTREGTIVIDPGESNEFTYRIGELKGDSA